MEAKGKCECGHGPRWHGPYADGYCRGYVRASKSEGTPGYACRCEGWTMADNSRSRDHSIIRRLHFAGYDFESGPEGTVIPRETVNLNAPGDHGADPIGDGTFRMVPSGDIVDLAERNQRLKERGLKRTPYGWE